MESAICQALEGRTLLAAVPPTFTGTASDADFNLNGTIDSADFAILAAAWNVPGAKTRATGDANLDGRADTIDFNVLTKWFGAAYTIAPDTPGPADGSYEFTLMAGQSLASISPRPGDDVRFLGDWSKISFPWSGTAAAKLNVWFTDGATVGNGQTGTVVQGGTNLTIHRLHVLNVRQPTLQAAGAAVKTGAGTWLVDSLIEDNEATGVAAISANGGGFLRTIFQRNGQQGFGVQFTDGFTVDGCKFLANNNGRANPSWKNVTASGYTVVIPIGGLYYVNPDWEAGANKLWSSNNVTVKNSEAAFNVGPGIWPDYKNTNHVYDGNYIHDNRGLDAARFYQGEGIRLELSPSAGGFTVTNNFIERNSGAGITLTSVRDVAIHGNTLRGPGMGVLFRRDDGRGGLTNIIITGNTFDHVSAAFTTWGSSSPISNIVTSPNTII